MSKKNWYIKARLLLFLANLFYLTSTNALNRTRTVSYSDTAYTTTWKNSPHLNLTITKASNKIWPNSDSDTPYTTICEDSSRYRAKIKSCYGNSGIKSYQNQSPNSDLYDKTPKNTPNICGKYGAPLDKSISLNNTYTNPSGKKSTDSDTGKSKRSISPKTRKPRSNSKTSMSITVAKKNEELWENFRNISLQMENYCIDKIGSKKDDILNNLEKLSVLISEINSIDLTNKIKSLEDKTLNTKTSNKLENYNIERFTPFFLNKPIDEMTCSTESFLKTLPALLSIGTDINNFTVDEIMQVLDLCYCITEFLGNYINNVAKYANLLKPSKEELTYYPEECVTLFKLMEDGSNFMLFYTRTLEFLLPNTQNYIGKYFEDFIQYVQNLKQINNNKSCMDNLYKFLKVKKYKINRKNLIKKISKPLKSAYLNIQIANGIN